MWRAMFVRLRWFVFGVLASFGFFAYLANQLRRMRDAITPFNLAKGIANVAADALDSAARRLSPRGID
jgi:predicted RND superfamily exporter protein